MVTDNENDEVEVNNTHYTEGNGHDQVDDRKEVHEIKAVDDIRENDDDEDFDDFEKVDDIETKLQMLDEQKKESKMKKDRFKNRKQIYQHYKRKVREVEKQLKVMKKEKIRQEKEAVRKAHEIYTAKLLRAQTMFKEKKKLDLKELKNHNKMIELRMKSLRKKLKAKCEAICYKIDTEFDQSGTRTEDRNALDSSESSQYGDTESVQEITEPSKSDKEVCRVLNALLDAEIFFDEEIILKINKLLKTDSKMHDFFDGYGRSDNNLSNPLRFELYNRLGPHNKLGLILDSKTKKVNEEHRDLQRSILEQVNKNHGNKNAQTETTLQRIYKFIFWRRGNQQNQSCSRYKAENMQRLKKDKNEVFNSMKQKEIVARTKIIQGMSNTNIINKTRAQKVDFKRKIALKNGIDVRVSPRSEISTELIEKKSKPNQPKHGKHWQRNKDINARRKGNPSTNSPACYSLHKTKRFQMTKSKIQKKIHNSAVDLDPIVIKDVTKPLAATFNLCQYLKSPFRKTDRIVQPQVERRHENRKVTQGIREPLESKYNGRFQKRQENNYQRIDREVGRRNESRYKSEAKKQGSETRCDRRLEKRQASHYERNGERRKAAEKCLLCARARETDTDSEDTRYASEYDTDCEASYHTDTKNSSEDSEQENETRGMKTREYQPRVGGILGNLLGRWGGQFSGQCLGQRQRTYLQPEVSGSDR